jgi:apolipoprotein D and lipocalin family protein
MRWLLCLCALLLPGCGLFGGADYAPLDTVPSVDLARYVGKWYEIASLPVIQQKGCSCTTAEYSVLEEGVIKVVNACRKGDEVDQAEAKAFVVEGSGNAKLRVQFFWPFRGDYWIIDLAEDYSYAVVGTPSRKYFWILSRTPTMPEDTLQALVVRIQARGFDTTQMQRTVHDCGM